MAVIRRDVWVLSAQKAWPDELLWYAKGIRESCARLGEHTPAAGSTLEPPHQRIRDR